MLKTQGDTTLGGYIFGLGVPHYVVDAPRGGGKIALIPDRIVPFDDDEIQLRNYEDHVYSYPSIPFFDEGW